MAFLVNVKEFAERHGVARKTVYEWEVRGWIVREGRLVDMEESDARVARYRDRFSDNVINTLPPPPVRLPKPPKPEPVPKPPKPPKPEPVPKPPKPPKPAPVPKPEPVVLPPLPSRAHFVDDLDPTALTEGRATTEEARRVKENFIALGKKLEYEQDSGNLIDVEVAKRLLFDEFRAVRNHWLGWPAKDAARIAADLGVEADLVTEVLIRYVHRHTVAISEPSASFGG